jgi:hypothetical protein
VWQEAGSGPNFFGSTGKGVKEDLFRAGGVAFLRFNTKNGRGIEIASLNFGKEVVFKSKSQRTGFFKGKKST